MTTKDIKRPFDSLSMDEIAEFGEVFKADAASTIETFGNWYARWLKHNTKSKVIFGVVLKLAEIEREQLSVPLIEYIESLRPAYFDEVKSLNENIYRTEDVFLDITARVLEDEVYVELQALNDLLNENSITYFRLVTN